MTHNQLMFLFICALITLLISVIGNLYFTYQISKTRPFLAFILFIFDTYLSVLFVHLIIDLSKLLF